MKVAILKTIGITAALLSVLSLLPVAYASVPGVSAKGAFGMAALFEFLRFDAMIRFIGNAGEPTRLFLFGGALVAVAVLVRRTMLPADVDSE